MERIAMIPALFLALAGGLAAQSNSAPASHPLRASRFASTQAASDQADRADHPEERPSGFTLQGLSSPATVADSIFVCAGGLPAGASVTYVLDGRPAATERDAPYWIGGLTHGSSRDSAPGGFSLGSTAPGTHYLEAVAKLPSGRTLRSSVLKLEVLPSPNGEFSHGLTPYPNELSAQQSSLPAILDRTTTPGAPLSKAEVAVRAQVLRMYANWGIDPSLDYQHDQSSLLLAMAPRNWAPASRPAAGTPLSLLFSPDAPYYHAIPALWPRVALPSGYFKQLQLNTNQQGDGIGFGEVTAATADPELIVTSQWYADLTTRRSFPFRIPTRWTHELPTQPAGDMHMIFVAPQKQEFVSSYKTSLDRVTGGPDALYASSPSALESLGDRGGSIAANFAELPAMLQPGEATDAAHPIRHALGGSVGRVWAARVFPASAWDGGVRTGVNTCTGNGFMNTGLVPYGGVIQLDPKLDLSRIKLTLPALRILQAIQTYGYYVMDFGCTDIDIYTAIPEEELDPYGGLWGENGKGAGVQNEVQKVLLDHTLYVVAPLTKKQ